MQHPSIRFHENQACSFSLIQKQTAGTKSGKNQTIMTRLADLVSCLFYCVFPNQSVSNVQPVSICVCVSLRVVVGTPHSQNIPSCVFCWSVSEINSNCFLFSRHISPQKKTQIYSTFTPTFSHFFPLDEIGMKNVKASSAQYNFQTAFLLE